jgi:hypothetical protein
VTTVALPSDRQAVTRATSIGQATAVEQSRAVAEVQAAVVVAQQCPRDVQLAVQQMRESCAQKALADRAFFRYSRDRRVVYENNANPGARRVREAIYAVLPPWFTEEAKELCQRTIAEGGGKPLAQRIADIVRWFEGQGVRLTQLEDKLGSKRAKWEAVDVSQLEVIGRSLVNGEITVDEEFPPARVTADDIPKRGKAKAPEQPAADPEPSADAMTQELPYNPADEPQGWQS